MEQEPIIVQKGGGGDVKSVNGKTGDVVLTTSDLENTSDYQTGTEVSSAISTAIGNLATVAATGDYDDLADKPTIGDATLTVQKNSTTVGTFSANATTNQTINITVPVTAADVSALPASTKYAASLTMSIDSTTYVVTTTLKDQDGNTLGTAQTIDLPLESVVVNGSYDSVNKKIVLTLQSGTTIDIPVADLVSGLQTEITSSNKLASDLVDDSNQTNLFVTSGEKSTWSGKQDTLTAGANISISAQNEISATDTTYSAFTGTDGVTAGTAGLVPAPATTDAGKFLKADGTWDTAGGGGGDAVYSTATTSNVTNGGAIYIGDKDSSQVVQTDPTTTDNHYKYFWALPYSTTAIPGSNSINILGKSFNLRASNIVLGSEAQAENSCIAIGTQALSGGNSVAVGYGANSAEGSGFNNYSSYVAIGMNTRARNNATAVGYQAKAMENCAVAIGYGASAWQTGSVALGRGAYPTRAGEVCVGSDTTAYGFNSTNYRVIGGVHDGQDAHDAATVGQINALIDAINTATNSNIPHIGS